jgi:hypothetical protein
MREQTSGLGQPVTKRRTLVPAGQGNYYQHPHPREDDPQLYTLEEDESYYVTRPQTSARRLTTISNVQTKQGVRVQHHCHDEPLIQRTSRQHQLPLQRTTGDDEEEQPIKRDRRVHWLVYVGIALFIGIVGWLGFTALGQWWQQQQDNWHFGNPRTYQTDAVVGHNDSNSTPSHFIAENLKGKIIVVGYPGGDPSKGRSYVITTIPDNQGNPPVKVKFQDLTGDGRLDMIVEIGDPGSTVSIFLFNNGQQFASKV